jgi:addiction module HigA family antidote
MFSKGLWLSAIMDSGLVNIQTGTPNDAFLLPLNISAYRLAKDVEIPQTRISEIIKGNRRITADTALRFGKYFRNSAKFWLGMQDDYDIEEELSNKGHKIASIKSFNTFLFLFFSITGASQVSNPDLKSPSVFLPEQEVRTDSFVFVGTTYALPRDCKRKNQSNCCSYRSNPDQVGCYEGTTLSYIYMPDLETAKMNLENVILQRENCFLSFEKKSITCFLLGKEVPGYQINYETKEGARGSDIITVGKVNNQTIFIELRSIKPKTKNKEIQPVFRQIIRLK